MPSLRINHAMPAYDLRTNARISGNVTRLPSRYLWAMRLFLGVFVAGFLLFFGSRLWSAQLKQRFAVITENQQEIHAAVSTAERRLWVPTWQSATIATQPLLINFFSNLPSDVMLSEVVFEQALGTRGYRFRAGINSDRNTAARRFREMLGILQSEGLSVISIQQLPASAGIVFEASLERLPKGSRTLAAANPAP